MTLDQRPPHPYTPSELPQPTTATGERIVFSVSPAKPTDPIASTGESPDDAEDFDPTFEPDGPLEPRREKVYLLSADGSSLYLLNTSSSEELPPPYAPYRRPSASDQETPLDPAHLTNLSLMGTVNPQLLGLVESPSRYHAARRQRAATTTAAMGGRRSRASSDAGLREPPHSAGYQSTRHDTGRHGQGAVPMPSLHRLQSDVGPSTRGSSVRVDERTPLLRTSNGNGMVVNALGINVSSSSRSPHAGGTRSSRSISVTSANYSNGHPHPPLYLENDGSGGIIASTSSSSSAQTPSNRVRPSSWRNMLRAPSQMNTPTLRVIDTPDGEAIVVTRPKKKRHPIVRYLRPLWSGAHWAALFHLVVINLPFAILLWPILVVGTVTGTILLITLPLGALVWFITLILARSACRLELKMQLYFHSPLRSSIPRPVYFPIFRRIKLAEGADGQVQPVVEVHGEGETAELTGVVHERNFFKNCWSMASWVASLPGPVLTRFTDHISYQCLYYLVVTKALITLASSIVIIVLVPISAALIVPLPGMLELVRRFGRWQAGVAVEGLQ
ncbi:hypothetical protein QFC20_003248 [Naganishia adeliensis]|uniref:Uncharacterized protein n=1 Tax=Naganishia adeliensis TaxID=92952 RepID=A0ACC2WE62_9TREE|nr:hypothetical protein QFC20_003248 [Naganishia adeliensis]